jgi:hypothetical protein
MIRKTMMALVLSAGLASTGAVVAGPFFNRPQAPTAAELGLDANQSAQWQAIQADTRSFRQHTLQALKAELDDTKTALASPDADLRTIGQDYQSIALAALMEQRQLRDRRLAFYESLNAQQQGEVRAYLVTLIDRAERAIRAIEVLQGTD